MLGRPPVRIRSSFKGSVLAYFNTTEMLAAFICVHRSFVEFALNIDERANFTVSTQPELRANSVVDSNRRSALWRL